MAKNPWSRIKEIVGTALERDPEERESYLAQACADDGNLRVEVESLLAAHAEAEGLSESPWAGADAGAAKESQTIGPYRLVRELGTGGMGQVWLAEQTEPVRRRVALKLIRAGMYDAALVKRFQSERQSLAIMDHPAIAKVFDAGATAEGQPYFAMEYVDGPPITDYCDRKKLGIRERLKLFIHVCEGVQHAHQKAIIHRDLKPSNILVAEVDGKPVPRIIDFGLAKAVAPVPGETLFTHVGSFLGTPGYMSPEQADPELHDVDTRTDVYSLGVVLYELLTGFLPFDSTQWKKQRLDEVLRQLRETDPQRPSTRVSAGRDTSTARAEARGTEPGQLMSALRGDLDRITLKALEKDRNRRYGTPSALAADVGNYLTNRPVEARPASAAYRLGKYVRRNRVAVAVAAGAAALLIAFAVMQAVELRRITRERDRADRVTEFMTNMFKVSDPSEARGNSITAREILDKSAKEIENGLANDPELQARMMVAMARTYQGLGLYPRAQALHERALAIERRVLGAEDPATLTSTRLLGWTLGQEGHYSEAEKMLTDTLAIQRHVLGEKHRDTLATMNSLGWILSHGGHFDDAEKLLRHTVELDRSVLGPDDQETLSAIHHLAGVLTQEGHLAESGALKRELLDRERRVMGPDNPLTLVTMNNLADNLNQEGRLAEAQKMYRELLELQRRVLGPEHPETLWTMRNLAVSLEAGGNMSEAEALYRQTLALLRRVLGNEHPDTLTCASDLGILLREVGNYRESEKILRETMDAQRKAPGPENPNTLDTTQNLAATLRMEGGYAEAETLLRETVAIDKRVLGSDNPSTMDAMENLAATLRLEGKCVEAEQLYRGTVEVQSRVLGLDNPSTLEAVRGLGMALTCEKRFPEADQLFRRAIEAASKGPEQAGLSTTWYAFGCAAALAGRRDEAFDHLREAIDHGYTDAANMLRDSDLKSLRGDRRFQPLVAEAQKHAGGSPKPN